MTRTPAAGRVQAGVTLIELVVAITVIAIAVAAVMGAMSTITSRSADAMVQQQALVIAEAYLEEVLQRPVVDPDGIEPEAGRGTYDDVDDYNGLADTGARDQFNNAIAALSGYNVSVAVVSSTALAPLSAALVRRVDVTVTSGTAVSARLSGYRVAY